MVHKSELYAYISQLSLISCSVLCTLQVLGIDIRKPLALRRRRLAGDRSERTNRCSSSYQSIRAQLLGKEIRTQGRLEGWRRACVVKASVTASPTLALLSCTVECPCLGPDVTLGPSAKKCHYLCSNVKNTHTHKVMRPILKARTMNTRTESTLMLWFGCEVFPQSSYVRQCKKVQKIDGWVMRASTPSVNRSP